MSGEDNLADQCRTLLQAPQPPETFEFQLGERLFTLTVTPWIGTQARKDLEAAIEEDPDLRDEMPDPAALEYFVAYLDSEANPATGQAGPEALLLLIPGVLDPDLPTWLADGPSARLASLGIQIGAEAQLLGFEAAVELGGDRRWHLVPDLISIEGLRFELFVERPLDEARRRIVVGASGTVGFGKNADGAPVFALSIRAEAHRDALTRAAADVEFSDEEAEALARQMAGLIPAAEKDDDEDEADDDEKALYQQSLAATFRHTPEEARQRADRLFDRLVVRGGLSPDADGQAQDVPLAGLLGHFGWASDSFAADVCITNIDFRYDSKGGDFSVAAAIAGPRRETGWPPRDPAVSLLDGAVTLETAAVTVRGSSQSGRVTGEVMVQATIAGRRLELRARCSAAGMVFEGHWEAPDPGSDVAIAPEVLNRWLNETFGFQLDPALETLSVVSANVSFDTATGIFVFDLEGALDLEAFESDAVSGLIRLEVRREETGFFSGSFSGVLLVQLESGNTLEFDLDVVKETGVSTLFAAYRESADTGAGPQEHTVSLQALANSLNMDSNVSSAAQLSIPAAYIAYATDDGSDATAMGMEIEGGLDLRRVALPSGLDLFRDALGEMSDISVDVDLAYRSGDALTATMSPLLERHGFRAPSDTGLSLRVRAQLGEERHDVASVSFGDDGGLSKPQNVPPSGSQADRDSGRGQRARDASGVRWIEVQKGFDALRLRRIGIGLSPEADDIYLKVLLDATFEAGGLEIALDGLGVTGPLSRFDPKLHLDGLGIDYHNGDIEIGGALLKTPRGFGGELLVRAEDLSLTVEGDFSTIDGHPSLVAYGVLKAPLGGPPCFFVTGLTAGFGYNRDVQRPELSDIPDFPLVSPLMPGGNPIQGVEALGREFTPTLGTHFLALGVAFTSFRMIDSFALAILKLSEKVELDMLGVSTLDLPVDGHGQPLVHARLLWSAAFMPETGYLDLSAKLSDDSYVFDRQCRPRGSMAFRAWLGPQPEPEPGSDSPREGDFVLTIGGYHKDYRVRPYEPTPDPVTLTWSVTRDLTIKGSAYFALTGSAAMAGGVLEATYDADIYVGHIHASFTAQADFLFGWSPLHYDARIHVQMEVRFTYHFFGTHHADFHAAANLHVWGPDFSMRAKVSVTVVGYEVSFRLSYNSASRAAVAIDLDTFLRDLLPENPISIRPVAGVYPGSDNEDVVILDPHSFVLSLQTAAPFGALDVLGRPVFSENEGTDAKLDAVGVRPCGLDSWWSTLRVEVDGLPVGDGYSEPLVCDDVLYGPVPSALWSKPTVHDQYGIKLVEPPDANGDQSVSGVPLGVRLRAGDGTTHGPSLPRSAAPHPVLRVAPAADAYEPSGGVPLDAAERQRLLQELERLVAASAA